MRPLDERDVQPFDDLKPVGIADPVPSAREHLRQAQERARGAKLQAWFDGSEGPDITRATDIASKAADLVGGDRDRQHGAKADNFERIAAVWNAWLSIRKEQAAPLDAHDVGCMMAMMKLARTQSGSLNIDDYVDAAGYASCAGEVAQG